MSPLAPMPTPQRVEIAPEGAIRIVWRDGHVSDYAPRELRAACPCAGCIDEWTGQVRIDRTSIPSDLSARSVRRVGNYALSFDWSDGHSTGIYAFDRLRDMCHCPHCAGG